MITSRCQVSSTSRALVVSLNVFFLLKYTEFLEKCVLFYFVSGQWKCWTACQICVGEFRHQGQSQARGHCRSQFWRILCDRTSKSDLWPDMLHWKKSFARSASCLFRSRAIWILWRIECLQLLWLILCMISNIRTFQKMDFTGCRR